MILPKRYFHDEKTSTWLWKAAQTLLALPGDLESSGLQRKLLYSPASWSGGLISQLSQLAYYLIGYVLDAYFPPWGNQNIEGKNDHIILPSYTFFPEKPLGSLQHFGVVVLMCIHSSHCVFWSKGDKETEGHTLPTDSCPINQTLIRQGNTNPSHRLKQDIKQKASVKLHINTSPTGKHHRNSILW